MAERAIEIRDYCTNYCAKRGNETRASAVVPILFRMDFGGLIFGFYSLNYNRNRASSVILRKVGVHASERDLFRMIEDGAAEAESLQSVRVVADHIAAWEALDELPAPIERCVKALEEEAMTFTYEHSATRLLKPRIEQDIRNYNAAQYANRLLVPVIFEMGRAGVVFGFYNDSEGGTANRGKLDSILLEYATTFNHKLEIWDAVTTGYHSKRSTRTALSFITHYYSLMDMPELAENEKARALIAAIPPKPVKVEQQEAQRRPQAPEEGYLKLWGWEIPVPKEIVPNALTQDLKLPELAEGLGKSAKKILATEIKNPFRNKKDQ